VLVLFGSIESESETACSSSKVNRLACVMSPMTRLLRLFVVEQLGIFRLSLAFYAIRKQVFDFETELNKGIRICSDGITKGAVELLHFVSGYRSVDYNDLSKCRLRIQF